MTKIEREKIVDFIDALMESDYSRANKDLGIVVKEKIKAKLEKAKHVKPFGEKAETEDCGCEDKKPKRKSKRGTTKTAKGKPEEKEEKNLPPWLKKIKSKK